MINYDERTLGFHLFCLMSGSDDEEDHLDGNY
jgi:hypothetical protein